MSTPHRSTLLTALMLGASAAAQTGWVQRLPTTQPPARGYHAMTFDLVRGTTLMFGGWNGMPLADTWAWNGMNWVANATAHSPAARCGNALATDLSRGRVVLFGGTNGAATNDMNDTWEYDGNDWVQIPTQTQPGVRRFARMEYDAAHARCVLFGGGPGLSPIYGDTWEWNGVAWTLRTPATSPPPRWAHGMAYDFARARIVLTGGSLGDSGPPLADTWAWDGTNWSQVLAAAPVPTTALGLANDVIRDVVVRFGGLSTGAETWLFDHASWRRDPRTLAPPFRAWSPLAHDLLRSRTVLFGGYRVAGPFRDDTWEYDPGNVAHWVPFGSGCAGTAGVPTLRPVGLSLPIVGGTFVVELLGVPGNVAAISFGFSDQQWGTNTLPWSLSALGMTGCTLHSSPDFVFFTPATAGRATLSWPLPNNASLIGTRFFDQGFVLDPGSNALGATVSNAGAGIIGPF